MLTTARDKNDQNPIGLGQIVAEVKVGEFYEVDFCSKWSVCEGGDIANWHFYRDLSKAILTKQYYTKKNSEFVTNPWLHTLALLTGAEVEAASRLLVDIFKLRHDRLSKYSTKYDQSLLE